MNVPFDALFQNCINGSTPMNKRELQIRNLLNHISWTTGPIQNNFTELFLITPSTNTAQMVPLFWTKGLSELQIRNIFKQYFPPELLAQIQKKFTELFLITPSTKTAQMVPLLWTKGLPELQIRTIFKLYFPPELLAQIQNNFTELFLITPSTKIAQMVPLCWTKGLPELQIRNIFKWHFFLNHCPKYKIIAQN